MATKLLLEKPIASWRDSQLLVDPNIEVSHTIIKRISSGGLYSIDALMEDAEWLRVLAVEYDEGRREEIIRQFTQSQFSWKTPRKTVFCGFVSKESPALPSSSGVEESGDQTQNEWVFSAVEILDRLESNATSAGDRLTAVLFAETTSFSESQTPRLLPTLMAFCIENRFSKNDEVVTATGAAIRKLAMNMPTSEFAAYANLFSPTATETLSCDLELELAKAIGWRLVTVENAGAGEYPTLEARLSELASDYLTSRLVLQENYASIVMHSVIAIALLNGRRQDEFIERISRLGIGWFKSLFCKRLTEVARKRQAAVPSDNGNLDRLIGSLDAAGS